MGSGRVGAGGDKLDGDETFEAGVFGFVDNSHATAAELFEDAVVRDDLANHGRAA